MKVRGISIPWITAELSRAMQDRSYHLKKAHKTHSQHHWSCYRKLRCLVNKEVRECKSKYYESLIRENRNNPSGLWKTLNELTSRNTHSTAPSCIVYLMALKPQTHNLYQHFLILFSLVSEMPWQTQSSKDFQKTYSSIIKYDSFIPHRNSRRSRLSQFSNNYQVLKLINLSALMASAPDCLKPGPDSLKSSVFPKTWKEGKETPIYKSCDRSNISNYRRITVLPILSKILERLVHTQIHSYLSENKILSQYQLALDLSCLPVPHLHSSLTPFLIMLITVLS